MILLLSLLGCDDLCKPISADADGDGAVSWRDCDAAASIPVEPCVATTWYPDADGDGAGSAAAPLERCEAPAGYVADGSDCDDADPSVLPGAVEACDDVDQDCDGVVDEGAPDDRTWYADADGDGYGVAATLQCAAPAGHAAAAGDCDDADPAVNPGAAEVPYDDIDQDCDGADDDCDASADCFGLGGADTRVDGLEDVDFVGYGVASAGDVDGDGRDDVWTGSLHVGTGAVLLVRGGTTGALTPATVDAVLVGEFAGDGFGTRFAGAGDVDGDGHDDVLVSGPYNEDGGYVAGAAWILHGPFAGTVEAADVGVRLVGAPDDAAGVDLTADADLDGDGALDIAILATTGVYVLPGATGDAALADAPARITGLPGYTAAVDAVGDLDGDGFSDLAVVTLAPYGKKTYDATLHLFRGPFVGVTDGAAADATLARSNVMSPALSIAGRGDADGDGRADLLVGVASYPVGVELYVDAFGVGITAPDALVEIEGASNWGMNAAWAGDVDGDGRDDALLVDAATSMDGGRGVAMLYTAPLAGTLGVSDATAAFASDTDTISIWFSAAAAGDVDADGLGDLVFGSPFAEPGGLYAGGSAWVVRAPF